MTVRSAKGWDRTTFGRLARIGNGADYSSVEVEQGGYPVYGSGGEFRRSSSYLYDGESVLFGRKGTVDRPLYVEGKFWTVDTMFYSVIDESRLYPRFAYYWATTLPFKAWATDTALPSMTSTAIKAAPIALPTVHEQRAIADYLDRETAQIDAFIAKNEELITLLTERRAAAIARTVTGRRLEEADDQGSDWMDGLPSEWTLLPVKLLAKRVTDGAHISPETEGGEYDFVSTRDISGGAIDFEGSLKTSSQTYSYMVRTGCQPKSGDILYSKDGTIGETAVVRESREFVVASSLIIITPDPSLAASDYLRYALSSEPLLEQAMTLVRGAGLPRLSVANLATVRVPLPPLEVQRELVGWLDQVAESIDSAIGVARRSIELARERRAALISAAVTGKIDVGVAA